MFLSFSIQTIVWLVLVIVFALVEAATVGLVSIWFAAGAVAALITSTITPSLLVQVVVFLLVSIAALVLTRPLVLKSRLRYPQPTNADRNVGRKAVVIEAITPDFPGRVKLDGVDWSARATEALAQGTTCIVAAVDGATLLVYAEPAPVTVS